MPERFFEKTKTRAKRRHLVLVPKAKGREPLETLHALTSQRVCTRGKTESAGRKSLKIKDLRDGMKRVDVEAKIVGKEATREVLSRYKDVVHRVANATISDGTGTIKLTLWNDQIDQVNVNDNIRIENGYVTTFRGEMQLNVGKYGKLNVQ